MKKTLTISLLVIMLLVNNVLIGGCVDIEKKSPEDDLDAVIDAKLKSEEIEKELEAEKEKLETELREKLKSELRDELEEEIREEIKAEMQEDAEKNKSQDLDNDQPSGNKDLPTIGQKSAESLLKSNSIARMISQGPPKLPVAGLEAVTAAFPAYEVADDFSNIGNLKEVEEKFGKFSSEELDLLRRNSFFVSPEIAVEERSEGNVTLYGQFFEIYDKNLYKSIPSFITVDSVLSAFHVIFDQSLRQVEEAHLFDYVVEFAEELLDTQLDSYEDINSDEVKRLEALNIAHTAMILELAGEDYDKKDLPAASIEALEEELQNVKNEVMNTSTLTGGRAQYSMFKVRGHYTASPELGKYFQAVMAGGALPYALDKTDDALIQSFLFTHDFLQDDDTMKAWKQLNDLTSVMVGNADDLDFSNLIPVYDDLLAGYEPDDFPRFTAELKEAVKNLKTTLVKSPDFDEKFENMPESPFCLIPQKLTIDAACLSMVTDMNRALASPVDFMSMMGSPAAEKQRQSYADDISAEWPQYPAAFDKAADYFEKEHEKICNDTVYGRWMMAIKKIYDTKDRANYPAFMQNEAYSFKDLSTGLGSYAQLKHDTVLYGKPVNAQMGGFTIEGGFVEPYPEVYNDMYQLADIMLDLLDERDMLNNKIKTAMTYFKDICKNCREISIKELKNQALTDEENAFITYYGGNLEIAMVSVIEESMRFWFSIENDTDRYLMTATEIASATDKASNQELVLSLGIGPAREIYAAVPVNGELKLCRGATFSYYEFVSDKRLTDEDWIDMVLAGKTPASPDWYSNFAASK